MHVHRAICGFCVCLCVCVAQLHSMGHSVAVAHLNYLAINVINDEREIFIITIFTFHFMLSAELVA